MSVRSASVEATTERGLGPDHRRIREQVLAAESTCWRCGKPGTADNPLTADHLIPRSRGGQNVRANYRAAHASCNQSAGGREGAAMASRPGRSMTPAQLPAKEMASGDPQQEIEALVG